MKKINKIYFYKVKVDNGGAPCVCDSVLTLAICKRGIRSTARENDWIIGFGGKNLKEKLIYIAQVTKKLLNGEYYKSEKYFKRPDCIYRWDDEKQKYYWVNGKKYHLNGLKLDDDLDKGKAIVLMSTKYTYFGDIGTSKYKEKYPEIRKSIEVLTQGHRVNHSTKLFNELISLIRESIVLEIEGKPTHQVSDISCGYNSMRKKVAICRDKTDVQTKEF